MKKILLVEDDALVSLNQSLVLKAAGYDPAAVLDILSKLAYEHPAWAKAIVPDDLLSFRVELEGEAVPPGGYRIGSSEFAAAHTLLENALARRR